MYQSIDSFYENLSCYSSSDSKLNNNSKITYLTEKENFNMGLVEDKKRKPIYNTEIKIPSLDIEGRNTHDPKVWGPPFWFSLHVSSVYYPIEASPMVKERMKNRILAIPYEIPCEKCRTHAIAYIEENRDRLDNIVNGRESLGKFYVDFHNQVNKRYGKRIWTYEEAYKYYSGKNDM
jgi:hypothetical protein